MLERQGHLPGYTGHIPKNPALEEVGQAPVKYSHIPNYQGFIPSVKAENLFGKTYGKITEMSALGTHNIGRDMPADDKYKSIAQDNYTSQMRIPVMPFRPKEYPEPAVDPIDLIPPDSISKFFGMRGQGGSAYYPESEQGDFNNAANEKNPEVKLTYQEARRLANS